MRMWQLLVPIIEFFYHSLFVEATLATELREGVHAKSKASASHCDSSIRSSNVNATHSEISMAECAPQLGVLQQSDMQESLSSRSTIELPQFQELEYMLRQCALRASGVLTSGLSSMSNGSHYQTPDIGVEPRLALVRVFFDCLQLGLCSGKLHGKLKRPRMALARSGQVSEFFAVRSGNVSTHPSITMLQNMLKKPTINRKLNRPESGDGNNIFRYSETSYLIAHLAFLF
jgi:hypothetical protein